MYPRVQFVASNAGCPTETINIWSHLLGTIWFCFSTTIFISNRPPSLRNTIILLYLMASALCFWCSTMYHMFNRCDYLVLRGVFRILFFRRPRGIVEGIPTSY
ncbi:hypothetical protein BU23DRAFT_334393 [Bimuria novae-zelandiae CBS 107.79]|uniref:Uncharacterized protein n=1 Tax=Bimuria novae-zelandiae CBS 107.79 TaxID=1447943 RepID=A0A6A5UQ31_9PLEO|nr:hypothetical protein BU23DRAFT_334393 [Bimuria novae-zelandiae CBS 107.79]